MQRRRFYSVDSHAPSKMRMLTRGQSAFAAATGRASIRAFRRAAIRSIRPTVTRYSKPSQPFPLIKGAIAPYAGRRELKYVDTLLDQPFSFPSVAPVAVNLIAEGDDNINRIGRLVTITSLEIRGMVVAPAGTDIDDCMVRIVVVWDNAANSAGAVPPLTEIFYPIPVVLPVNVSAESVPNIDNSSRFSILSDESFGMGQFIAPAAFNSPCNTPYHKFLTLNSSTRFSGTSATIGSIQNGALYVLFLRDMVNGVNPGTYRFSGVSRIRFSDS